MIYVFLANGFEEVEALTAVDLLRRAELSVVTVGVGGKIITGSHGIAVTTDMEEAQAETEGLDAVILPGGMPGTLNLEASPIVRACVDHCAKTGGLLAAICAAPSILGHMGLLQGKRAVCYPGFEQELAGAEVGMEPVCEQEGLVTARGAGVAVEFALALIKKLCGNEEAERIRMSIQCM